MAVAGDHQVTGDATVEGTTLLRGDASVSGALSVWELGASVWKDSNQAIPSDTKTKVTWNRKRADDRNEFDTGTSQFTTATPGDYRVDTGVGWAQWFDAGDYHVLYLYVDGSIRANDTRNSPGDTIPSSLRISKDLHGLAAGATIEVRVHHNHGSDRSVGGSYRSWLDVTKVG